MGLNPTPITDSTPKILSRTVEGQPAGEAGLLVLDLLFLFACMWRVAPTFCIPRNGSPQKFRVLDDPSKKLLHMNAFGELDLPPVVA